MNKINRTKPNDESQRRNQNNLRILRGVVASTHDLQKGHPEKILDRFITTSMKLASESIFKNELASPLALLESLNRFGPRFMGWTPEVLMSAIDHTYNGWSNEQVVKALNHFHETGEILSDVPALVRQKIYSIRIILTSDTPHTEWHVFEKIGSAFNDRVPQFGLVEPLSASECARTVALIDRIRPDKFSNEIKIYCAACCHEDGLLTVMPLKWLSLAEAPLQQMNYESSGNRVDAETKEQILKSFKIVKDAGQKLNQLPDDLVGIQAVKLAAIDKFVEDSLTSP